MTSGMPSIGSVGADSGFLKGQYEHRIRRVSNGRPNPNLPPFAHFGDKHLRSFLRDYGLDKAVVLDVGLRTNDEESICILRRNGRGFYRWCFL
jgi:hypothetical protein